MSVGKHVVRGVVIAAFALASAAASAQPVAEQKSFEPVTGQAGKDVIWVPTPQVTVDTMLGLAKLTATDHLVDLGSGNGITVITAAKRGATAHGVEFNPDMVALSRRLATEAGVAAKATFSQGDLFEADLSKATVITLFLLPDINRRLRPSLLELTPGTRVVSNTFDMGDWEPDEKQTAQCTTSWCKALLWVVPAKVAGTWRLGPETLLLTQKYQVVEGTLGPAPISAGRLSGADLTFTAGGRVYTGRVTADAIRGEGWSATRGL
ncbi:MAG: methyltransferase domain-containing protein [Vicinamibacteraceae bacterium]